MVWVVVGRSFYKHRAAIKIAFQYYALAGVPVRHPPSAACGL